MGLAALSACSTSGVGHSPLWGTDGESWTPQSRLPDFSRAGYMSGYETIPEVPVASNVKHFGAVGDGQTDDSDAFLAAIAATDEGAIWIPAGRYVVTSVLRIDKGGVVLRGAGPALTTLVIPTPLQELDPVALNSAGQLPYSFRGAFVTVEGKVEGTRVARVVAPASRGDTWLRIDTTEGVRVGDWLRLLIRSSRS
ncbi:MAG: glycosyl hydrolase family 28-related protein, partial [Longimicrobiales bacterium]